MLLGPLCLVAVFGVLLWAVRGIEAIKFIATYKVKPAAQPADEPIGHPPIGP